ADRPHGPRPDDGQHPRPDEHFDLAIFDRGLEAIVRAYAELADALGSRFRFSDEHRIPDAKEDFPQ
ncbi:hypothetical protein AB1398_01410, partial [Hydrogenibacillus schlegelii]